MKKISLIRLALVLMLALAIAVTMCSCGGKKESKEENTGEKEAVEEKVEEKTLEQYFEENPQDLQDIKDGVLEDESMKQALEVLDFDVYAKGNTLYYDYQFKDTYAEAQAEQMKEPLAQSLDEMGDSISSTIGLIESGFGVKDVTIHIFYKNGDGSVLAEKDFTK